MSMIDAIKEYNDVAFDIGGTPCGVASEVHDSIPIYQSWCGQNVKEYDNLDALVKDGFFLGKTLEEISKTVEYRCI